MISEEKVESRSAKWKEKWDKRLASRSGSKFSKFDAKATKWKTKWNKRQECFSHNNPHNWNLKWARKAAKIARKFGEIDRESDDEIRKMRLDDFYISSHF